MHEFAGGFCEAVLLFVVAEEEGFFTGAALEEVDGGAVAYVVVFGGF